MIYLIKYLNSYYLLNTSYFISQKTDAFIHIAIACQVFLLAHLPSDVLSTFSVWTE